MNDPCAVPGCGRATYPGDYLCPGHRTRKTRGQDLAPPIGHDPRGKRHPDLLARLRAACLAYAEADTQEDYRRANARLRMVILHIRRKTALPQATLVLDSLSEEGDE